MRAKGKRRGKEGGTGRRWGFASCCFPYDSSLLLPQICSALPSIVPMLPRLWNIDKGSKGPVKGTFSIPSILSPLPGGEGNINGDCKSAEGKNTFVVARRCQFTLHGICVCMCMCACRRTEMNDGVSTAAWNLKSRIAASV